MRFAVALAIGSALLAGPLQGQQYRFARDTVRYDSENSYFMYFVRAGDTLGQPVTTHTRETHFGMLNEAQVSVTLSSPDDDSFRNTTIYEVSPSGRVIAVNGTPVARAPNARVDFLPRLPEPPAAIGWGTAWDDTVSLRSSQPYGATYYTVQRRYAVARLVDSLGAHLVIAVATGTMRLRQGGWQDSTRGLAWWQEVAGPVVDTVTFDLQNGQLVSDVATMDLAGQGGAGPAGSGAAMPSGLRSRIRRVRLPDQHPARKP